ncbi:IS66 family insertion sequence element accessory protein TnpB, partial [Lawsonibacter sp. LCP25S3_G6]|uniref:IS66 family insertion sequence element accessory protein TnpB n=1 Tax=unclassified Lawsonibacter TaxID=2617946 RepID=UPI003F9D79CD
SAFSLYRDFLVARPGNFFGNFKDFALAFSGISYCLITLYKRLGNGSFQWPRSPDEVQALTPQQYHWLMEGLENEQPTAIKRYLV